MLRLRVQANNLLKFFLLILLFFSVLHCRKKETVFNPNDPEIIHRNVKRLTEVMIYDIFSPPVASRIYSYTCLAQFEAVRYLRNEYSSLANRYNGFDSMPRPSENFRVHFILAATKAFFTVADRVIFSKDSLKAYTDTLYAKFATALPSEEYRNSLQFGDSVGKNILRRLATDNYKETRGMPKFIGERGEGKWEPTSPDYLDATEPYWSKILPFSLDSSMQFRANPPLPYNADTASLFYKMVYEVYAINEKLTDEQKTIARYWDDNPFVMEHSGHLMFANKKITPGGHWMGITAIACRNADADAAKSAQAYALVAPALLDAFISCWETKYKYQYVRPITAINDRIKRNWNSFLQTPPFPEYTSGHSTISGSASEVLTALFGDGKAFLDDSDKPYIGMTRQFQSFRQAAEEASISRLYGGIHYRASLDSGLYRGRQVGNHLLARCGVNPASPRLAKSR